MSLKEKVNCSQCNAEIMRIKWNYGKKRPIKEFFCDNDCKGAWQKAQREALGYTKEWLMDQYWTQNKSANDIAREIGRNSKRVWEWIKDYGIETRPRGHDERQHIKKGVATFLGKKHRKESKEKIRQARLKDKHVPYLKDGIHWMHHPDFKKSDHPASKGGISPERQAFYATEEWANAVKQVWKRDNATCQRCGKYHNSKEARGTFHIHHIVSFIVKEHRANPDNLILLCKDCHRWVHSNRNKTKELIKEYI